MTYAIIVKAHTFWEGHKILRNLHHRFDWHYLGQIYGWVFTKFWDLLRMNKLYLQCCIVAKASRVSTDQGVKIILNYFNQTNSLKLHNFSTFMGVKPNVNTPRQEWNTPRKQARIISINSKQSYTSDTNIDYMQATTNSILM